MDIVLTITRTADGQVTVNGPLLDKITCYGLLEVARDTIKDHNDAKAKSSPIALARELPFSRS